MNRRTTSHHSLLTMFRWRSYFILTAIALDLLALSPTMRAVSPAPDGGYAGGNTAEGQNALLGLTAGTHNTAVGYYSLKSNTTASFNTALGAAALFDNTTGTQNTAMGAGALLGNTNGDENTANGYHALRSNTSGNRNTATGDVALGRNTTGVTNTADGAQALYGNRTGDSNTAVGDSALVANTTGYENTSVGTSSMTSNTNGKGNIALGFQAGLSLTTGNNNIDIGNFGLAGESHTIRIGGDTTGLGTQTVTYIAGISGATSSDGAAVFVNSNGRLGTQTSSARFKDKIKPIGNASEAILALRPVTFRYKKEIDPQGIPQFGLVAEDVEKVNPDLVIRDANGKPQTVRYEQVNAMLLNEFLKEHGKVKKLEAALDAVKKRLNEQETRIQKVSAEVEVSEPAAKTALNSQ